MRRFPNAIILSALAALVFLPRLGETCGPFFSAAIFARAHGPDRPMADFAGGKIGVVLPDWYAVYRIVAYRYLESKPLSAEEQQSLLEHYDAERRIEPLYPVEQAAADWTSARSKYYQQPAPNDLQEYKPTKSLFFEFPNCLKPAFITATTTLRDRARQFGATSPELQEWIRGQDAVFSNCGGGSHIPPELPATASPLLRADRAYQIAAAYFYAGTTTDYEFALQRFQAIADDKSSPWHNIAPYLIARTLIRQASFTAAENQTHNPAYLAKAEVQLDAILKDPAQQSMHDAAGTLLGFVRYHLYPEQREAELGKALADGGIGIHFGQDLVDYTWLGVSPNPEHDDLSDWLSEGGSLEGAVAKWRATRSMPWLVAVLWQLKPRDAAFTEVMGAAAKVPPISEAYATVAYYRARLARQSGNVDLARGVLKAAWAQSKTFPPSAIHLFQDEQMQVATDFESFESRLWQNPIEYDDDVGNIDPCADSNEHDCGPQFSPAAATLLNTRVPADVFARVAQRRTFPANLHQRIAPSAWARAALLDQPGLARQVAQAAGEAEPALRPYLQEYSQAQTPEERQFAAVFAILHFPGLRPYVDGPIPRLTPFQEIDSLRENWWCGDMGGDVVEINFEKCWREDGKGPLAFQAVPAAGTTPAHWEPVPTGPSLTSAGFPAFLSAAEKQRAATEWRELYALGTASRYLPRVVIDWGKKHPNDPRVPEALYLAIRAMRYGSSNELSHEAFLLLHQNYPKSEWARKTPFWFK